MTYNTSHFLPLAVERNRQERSDTERPLRERVLLVRNAGSQFNSCEFRALDTLTSFAEPETERTTLSRTPGHQNPRETLKLLLTELNPDLLDKWQGSWQVFRDGTQTG